MAPPAIILDGRPTVSRCMSFSPKGTGGEEALSSDSVISKLRGTNPQEVAKALDFIVQSGACDSRFIQPLLELLSYNDSLIFGKALTVLVVMRENNVKFTLSQDDLFLKRINGADVKFEDGGIEVSVESNPIELAQGIVLEKGRVLFKDGNYYLVQGEGTIINGFKIDNKTTEVLLFFDGSAHGWHGQKASPYLSFDRVNSCIILETKGDLNAVDVSLMGQKDVSAEYFVALGNKKGDYLQNLFGQKEITIKKVFYRDGYLSSSEQILQQAGGKALVDLDKKLETLYSENYSPKQREKIFMAFQEVHRFILEKNIVESGRQEVIIWGNDGSVSIGQFLYRVKSGNPMFDPGKTMLRFLEDGREGPLLKAFMVEVIKVAKSNSSNLAKIKKIYDLVAEHVPFFHWYHGPGERGTHGFQSFEQLLSKKGGICSEKNPLLIYALREAGFDAYEWGPVGHISTRVNTSEGVLEIDVTNSNPFSLIRLTTKGEYGFVTNEAGVKSILPEKLQQYAQKWDEGDHYRVFIPLDSAETLEWVALHNRIKPEELKEFLTEIADVKPHPLYMLGQGSGVGITTQTAGKYRKDLFE